MVDFCLLKYLGSSLIDFHIPTDKLSLFSLRLVPLFKSRFKAWSSHSKRIEKLIVHYRRSISDDPSKLDLLFCISARFL